MTRDRDEIDRMLSATLDDRYVSRGEKRALHEVLSEVDADDLDFWRHRAFALARERLSDTPSRELVGWLEDVVKLLRPRPAAKAGPHVCEACFSPGDGCRTRILHYLAEARRTADICVFTITDDRMSRPVIEAYERGVRVRIISDDDKAGDRGSDILRFEKLGIEVRVDHSEHHMHHKFALFDQRVLVTGSYNWTRTASDHNRENVVITDDPRMVRPFRQVFEDLWKDFTP